MFNWQNKSYFIELWFFSLVGGMLGRNGTNEKWQIWISRSGGVTEQKNLAFFCLLSWVVNFANCYVVVKKNADFCIHSRPYPALICIIVERACHQSYLSASESSNTVHSTLECTITWHKYHQQQSYSSRSPCSYMSIRSEKNQIENGFAARKTYQKSPLAVATSTYHSIEWHSSEK